MLGGRRARTKTEENRAITPDEIGRGSPRSRKCLDMEPRARRSPLKDSNLLEEGIKVLEECTPQKDLKATGRKRKADVIEPSSPEIIPNTPSQFSCKSYTQVATPRSVFSATPQRSKSFLLNTPGRRYSSRSPFVIPEQFRIVPSSSKKKTPLPPVDLPEIAVQSFYKTSGKDKENPPSSKEKEDAAASSGEKTETREKVSKTVDAMGDRKTRSEPRNRPSNRLVRSGSFKKYSRSSRASAGMKRKREGGNKAGFGHAIKRPKKKRKVDIKISEFSAMSIELPGSKLKTPKTPTTSAAAKPTSTPKTGNFSLSKETCVDYEVKGGQIIYRKSNTPVRRSPRKHMSPLKQSYFEGVGPKGRRSGSKLFSPQADFLNPDSMSPVKNVPSPVKFSVSTEDDDSSAANISDIIDRLEEEDEDENTNDLAGQNIEMRLTAGKMEIAAFNDIDPAKTAYDAVQDILGNLPEISSDSFESQSSEEACTARTDGKLYPIFYKETAKTGESSLVPSKNQSRKVFLSEDPDQLVIDAGQTRGPTLCLTCGVVYSIGDPADERAHEENHNSVMERLKFPGWKNERVCGNLETGRVVMVQPGDPKYMWKKVEEALSVVDRDLGFSEVGIRYPNKTKVFLYIVDKKIVGFLLAESIDNGFRVISREKESERAYYSSETPVPVKCGISRIWVIADHRRQGVATHLLERMRNFFILGHRLAEDEFAFSDPTLNGMDFASSYMKRADFLVYSR